MMNTTSLTISKRAAVIGVITALMIICMLMSTSESAMAADDTHIYISAKDLSNTARHNGTGIVESFLDQHSNGNKVKDNLTLLLEKSGDYVEYDIDLADKAQSAVLKVYGYNAAVWVIPSGGDPIALKPTNGGLANRGVNLYALTEVNALAGSDNKFAVRVGYSTGTVVLNAIYIQTAQAELTGAYTLDPVGRSYLQSVYDLSPEVTRYYDNELYPTLHIPNGKFVTLAFDYVDSIPDLTFEYEVLGEAITAEMSTNLSDWKSVKESSGKISSVTALSANKKLYIRFSAKSGDSFLKQLKLSPVQGGGAVTPSPLPSPTPTPGTSPTPAPSPDSSAVDSGGTSPFKPFGGKDKRYLYIPIKDLTNASRSNGQRIVADFLDTYEGGSDKTVNPTLLLQDAGEYVEYDIDLADSVTKAVLKVNMKDGVVSVKPTGGQYVTLKAVNDSGARFDRSVAIFELNESNGLKHKERTFTVQIKSNGEAVVLNSLAVETSTPEIGSGHTLKPLGESYMKHLHSVTQNVSRYFFNSVEPTVFIKKNGQVTLKFAYGKQVQSFSYSYANEGEPLTVQASVDGQTWHALNGMEGMLPSSLPISASGQVFVRFSAKSGDSFLRSFTLKPETTALPATGGQDESEPVSLPADQRYVYFKVGTSAEKPYMYGAGSNRVAEFESTHKGLAIDGFEGGYLATLPPNARFFDGQSVTYEFDLHDSLKTAQLRIYGLAGMKLSVAAEGKQTFVPLTAAYAPSGNARGYYGFDLTEANSLSAGSNKFRLMISGANGILFEVAIVSDLPGKVSQGVLFTAQSEPGIRYLVAANNVGTYYAHEQFSNYVLGGEGVDNSYLLYRVDLTDSVSEAKLYATYSGTLQIAISNSQNGSYTNVLQSSIGGSGTPPTNTVDLEEFVKQGRTLYIKVTGGNQQGYLDNLGIAVTAMDGAAGAFDVFTAEEAAYLYAISSGPEGYGQSNRQHKGTDKLRALDANGEIVYKIDLPNELSGGIELVLNAVEGQFELLVSPDGAEYRSVLAKMQPGEHIVQEHDVLLNNDSKVLYVKVVNTSISEAFVFKGLSFTTADVTPARQFERPVTGDFDYSDVPQTELAGFVPLPDPRDVVAAAAQEQAGQNKVWVLVGSVITLLILGAAVWMFIRKRSKGVN